MTQNGCVLLGVDSPDSLRVAQALAQALPGADLYYAQQRPEQQHLTLGRFGGSDAAGFAAWLSESLAGQNNLLPSFTGSHVQLSDEARFPNHPIALTGGATGGFGGGLGGGLGALGNGSGLGGGFGGVGGGFDAPVSRPIGASPIGGGSLAPIGSGPISAQPIGGHIGAPIGAPVQSSAQAVAPAASNPPTYASAMASGLTAAKAGSYAAAGAGKPASPSPAAAAAAQSPEALLSMLQSATAGAEGVGVLGTSASASSGYVLRPQEQAAWSQRLAPLVTNLQGVLSTVGAQRFCQMIDRVANPNDWSLASEVSAGLAGGARLEVVQDAEIAAAIEASAIATANTGAHVRLTAVAVDQNSVGAPGHNNTGSPVMVCRSERATDPSSGLTRVASFALHLEPVSQLSAAEKPYLSLVFAWLGLRQAPSSAASAVASGGAPAKVAEAPPPAGGGGGVRRPGDWTCPNCHAHNFASRSVCFKCKNPKVGGSGGGGPSFGSGASGDLGSKAPEPASGPTAGNFRPGDWICTGCRAHNFASRSACFKCKMRKAGSESAAAASSGAASSGGSARENFRSGDWICNNCGAHNFASRAACFKCSSKPN